MSEFLPIDINMHYSVHGSFYIKSTNGKILQIIMISLYKVVLA